jgi:hypothetical protein
MLWFSPSRLLVRILATSSLLSPLVSGQVWEGSETTMHNIAHTVVEEIVEVLGQSLGSCLLFRDRGPPRHLNKYYWHWIWLYSIDSNAGSWKLFFYRNKSKLGLALPHRPSSLTCRFEIAIRFAVDDIECPHHMCLYIKGRWFTLVTFSPVRHESACTMVSVHYDSVHIQYRCWLVPVVSNTV